MKSIRKSSYGMLLYVPLMRFVKTGICTLLSTFLLAKIRLSPLPVASLDQMPFRSSKISNKLKTFLFQWILHLLLFLVSIIQYSPFRLELFQSMSTAYLSHFPYLNSFSVWGSLLLKLQWPCVLFPGCLAFVQPLTSRLMINSISTMNITTF